jgi:DNA-binding transcriptional MocR family regulator
VQRLAAARTRAARLAVEAGFAFVTPPQGLFGWLDMGVDTDRLAERMHADGWLLAPGSLFHALPRPSRLMRVNFAVAQDARVWRALRAACQALDAGIRDDPTLNNGGASRGRGAYHSPRKAKTAPEPHA